MIALLMAAWFGSIDPAQAAAYFSPEALTRPASGCGNGPRQPSVSDFDASWYAAVWIRADEASLAASASAASRPTWRFTEIPSFTQPMIFRISEEPDGRLRMIAKRLSGKGGYDPGTLKDHVDRLLKPDEQSRFRKALASVDDVFADRTDDCDVVLDGERLILERTQAGQYAVGQRDWDQGQPMAGMGALLSGFVGWGRALHEGVSLPAP